MSVKPIFVWYDLWIGIFIDRAKGCAYVFPVPCFGFRVSWRVGQQEAHDG